MTNYKYTDDIVARMKEVASNGVTPEIITSLHKEFNFPERSIAAKFRALKMEVPTKVEKSTFTAEETKEISDFLQANSGQFTAAEVATKVAGGKFSDRQIMGKALSLELTSHLKKTEKKVVAKSYTPEEESLVRSMQGEGKFIEEIAAAVGKDVSSVRGKLLSMDLKAPQRDKKVQSKEGSYPGLAEVAATMTVDELVAHYSKTKAGTTARGIKTALSRRRVSAKDYDVSKKVAA